MTPRELCDLAEKINAAVPGLVYDFRPDHTDVYWVDRPLNRRYFSVIDAAAMMLGRLRVAEEVIEEKMRGEDVDDKLWNVLMELDKCGGVLHKYVASTLPGAKK